MTSDYDAWLQSPYGQVHVNATHSLETKALREAQATLDHFQQHPDMIYEVDDIPLNGPTVRSKEDRVDVYDRCQPDWWTRIQQPRPDAPKKPLSPFTNEDLITSPFFKQYIDNGQYVGQIIVCTKAREPKPLMRNIKSPPLTRFQVSLVRMANQYLLEAAQRKDAGSNHMRLGVSFYKHINRRMRRINPQSTPQWVEAELKALGIIQRAG